MSAHAPHRPDEELDEETRRILDERLKTLDEDIKTAAPLEQVIREGRAKLTKLKQPAL